MIIINTMFLNEKHILDLRLKEELPYVDEFHIVESDNAFSGRTKPIFLNQTRLPAKVFHHLITLPPAMSAWDKEYHQRNLITSLRPLADDDVIISCDMDEVLRGEGIPHIVEHARQKGYVGIKMKHHYYKINNFSREGESICKSVAVTGKYLRESGRTLEQLRSEERKDNWIECGHHFDYLATPEDISWKLTCFAHTEYSGLPYIDVDFIKERIELGEDLFQRLPGKYWLPGEVDGTYPQEILDNMEDWKEWLA